ncbi:MAG: hypothetical protein RR303_03890 [Bacteroidales bacterium]
MEIIYLEEWLAKAKEVESIFEKERIILSVLQAAGENSDPSPFYEKGASYLSSHFYTLTDTALNSLVLLYANNLNEIGREKVLSFFRKFGDCYQNRIMIRALEYLAEEYKISSCEILDNSEERATVVNRREDIICEIMIKEFINEVKLDYLFPKDAIIKIYDEEKEKLSHQRNLVKEFNLAFSKALMPLCVKDTTKSAFYIDTKYHYISYDDVLNNCYRIRVSKTRPTYISNDKILVSFSSPEEMVAAGWILD